jgi:hypothetical protein
MPPLKRFPASVFLSIERPWSGDPQQSSAYVLPAFTRNLSQTGIGLELEPNTIICVGDQVEVSFQLQKISFKASVVWTTENRCGLKITQLYGKSRTKYKCLLKDPVSLD